MLLAAASLCSCDDSTSGIGSTTIPEGDKIPAGVANYKVRTSSLLADSVLARTSTAYLGKYTDQDYGQFSADFIAQFYCNDNFKFKDNAQDVISLKLYMEYSDFFGDSINAMRLQVDTLDTLLPSDSTTFYTSVDPTRFYNENARPVATKAYTPTGPSVWSQKDEKSGITYYKHGITLPLELGKHFLNKYKESKDNFKDAQAFLENVFKGVYMHATHGDGSVLYVTSLYLELDYTTLVKSSSGALDSLVNNAAYFSSTKEIIQSNHFKNSDRLKELVKDDRLTYIKSPAGIYTEAELPIEEIHEKHMRDTLNLATITFTRYNEKVDKEYPMKAPEYLLMLRKKDLHTFFEKNESFDNITSFLSTLDTKNNNYRFDNITRLIDYCIAEKNKGLKEDANWLQKHPDWNKVVLLPVRPERDSQGNIIGAQNNLDMESTRLKGGASGKDELELKVLYTTF